MPGTEPAGSGGASSDGGGSDTTTSVRLDDLPEWAQRLAAVLTSARAHHLVGFAPPPGDHRQAAVLILFGPGRGSQGELVLIERSAALRAHPSQVAFPGGSFEPGEDAVQAALREAHEETGLDPSSVRVLGLLPTLFLTPSSFAVTPVLAWWERPHPLAPHDDIEVARVLRVPLPDLLDATNRFSTRLSNGFRGPAFGVDSVLVWGFTGGLLSRLLDLAGIALPWDDAIEREVPAEQLVGRRTPPPPA